MFRIVFFSQNCKLKSSEPWQYFLDDYWNFQHFRFLLILTHRIYHQHISKNTRTSWTHFRKFSGSPRVSQSWTHHTVHTPKRFDTLCFLFWDSPPQKKCCLRSFKRSKAKARKAKQHRAIQKQLRSCWVHCNFNDAALMPQLRPHPQQIGGWGVINREIVLFRSRVRTRGPVA